MPCELCGRECKGCREAIIDGAKMFVCPDCIKYSEGGALKEPEKISAPVKRFFSQRLRKPTAPKDIYKDMVKELSSDWPHRIQEARTKKGLTREELGFRIGERTVTIAKIENGDLRPSDQMIAKLEKELGIKLFEEIKDVPQGQQTRSHTNGMTLGDFIKPEK